MRAGMGNLLETDSDVASISDGEKERTDGDGMESEAVLDVNKNANSSLQSKNDSTQSTNEPDKTADDSVALLRIEANKNLGHGIPSQSPISLSSVQPSTSCLTSISSVPEGIQLSSGNLESVVKSSAAVLLGKSKTVSPRELPPRSQLIQLKPVMSKPKLTSRNSMDSLSEGLNKQKNPRFIPYEPYRGAVRPMVADDETTKKHSRNASEASAGSSSLENVIGSLNLNDNSIVLDDATGCSAEHANGNTHHKSLQGRQLPVNIPKVVYAQYVKHEKVIEKQTHALILLKERLKIAEKDNDDLHKENIRLKKLLVDSLSGDILQNRTDVNLDHAGVISPETSESVVGFSCVINVDKCRQY